MADQFAIADGVLDAEHFIKIMEGNGDGPIEWTDASQNLPVCRAVDQQGAITTSAITADEFLTVFKKLFIGEYLYTRGSMNVIRRAVGKELDGMYKCFGNFLMLTTARTLHRDGAVTAYSAQRPCHFWAELCRFCVFLRRICSLYA